MKKFLAFVALCALLLSLGGVCTSAASAYPEGIAVTPGVFAGVSGENFSPVGEVEIQLIEDVAEKVDMTDGDISDWLALGLSPTTITADNMVSWVGGAEGVRDPGMPAEWGVTAYYVADPTYLYMIYDITDSDFTYGDTASVYSGDALQLSIDFGGKMAELLENEPDIVANPKGIFYSFSCTSDGAPLQIMRQESDADGLLSEANGDGVKGAARKTETGWSVELALSWQRLYDDYCWKAWSDAVIYVGGMENLPLKVNMALNYLNRTETSGEITWAASSTNGRLVGDTKQPGLSWTTYDNGMELRLYTEEGFYFDCEGIWRINVCEALPLETEPPYDPPVETVPIPNEIDTEPEDLPTYQTIAPDEEENYGEVVTVYETGKVSYDASDDGEVLDEKMNAILQKYGCSAVAGAGTLTAFLALAAVACLFKKKDS